ncbi:MAG: hypothetical protein ACI9JY_001386 [Saprospiraceae bacterium]|jgi:hypothetical protein
MKMVLQKSFSSSKIPHALPQARRTVIFEARKPYGFLASQFFRKLSYFYRNYVGN